LFKILNWLTIKCKDSFTWLVLLQYNDKWSIKCWNYSVLDSMNNYTLYKNAGFWLDNSCDIFTNCQSIQNLEQSTYLGGTVLLWRKRLSNVGQQFQQYQQTKQSPLIVAHWTQKRSWSNCYWSAKPRPLSEFILERHEN
jgi:hypothetical protein